MSISHLLLIAIVALLLFGPHKLPELGRMLGKTVREVKRTANDLMGGLQDAEPQPPQPRKDVTPPPPAQAAQPVAAAAAQQPKPPEDSRRLPD